MYVSWNDFNVGGGALFVRYSTDNGATWTNARQITTGTPFIRDVQITGDLATGDVYLAGMNENGGGLTTRNNLMFRSTDGGNTWINTYTGPTFNGPGRGASGYFATMYNNPVYWRHMGWGEPAALNGVVHYVYDSRNTATGDAGNVFYIRSTDRGVTFSAPFNSTPTLTPPRPSGSLTSQSARVAAFSPCGMTSERGQRQAASRPAPAHRAIECGRDGRSITVRRGWLTMHFRT